MAEEEPHGSGSIGSNSNSEMKQRQIDVLKDLDKMEDVRNALDRDDVEFEITIDGWVIYTHKGQFTVRQLDALKALSVTVEDDKCRNTIVKFRQHRYYLRPVDAIVITIGASSLATIGYLLLALHHYIYYIMFKHFYMDLFTMTTS